MHVKTLLLDGSPRRGTTFIKWLFPPEGWFKLNSDGASKGNPGDAGCGGLFRDASGSWVHGYEMHIGCCSSFSA